MAGLVLCLKSWARAIGALVTALVLLAGFASGAGAKPSLQVHERSLRLAVEIRGSNGFRGFISTEGHKRVTLTLARSDGRFEIRTAGRVSRNRIVARFGDLGRIALRFQGEPEIGRGPRPRGPGQSSEPVCSGRRPIIERGVFHGIIQFRGENDFTRVDTRRAPGAVERHFRRVCRKTPQDGIAAIFKKLFEELPVRLLEVRGRVDGTNVLFMAVSFDLGSILGSTARPAYAFIGGTVERHEGMRIRRSANVQGGEGDYLAAKPGKLPQTVTVVPPKPFLGSAKHHKEAGVPASWIGTLGVRLPGAGLVPLTGQGFRSAYCNRTLGELGGDERCLPRRAEPGTNSLAALAWAAVQGSGSQSQAFWDVRLSWSR
jgi:hypothetical protein